MVSEPPVRDFTFTPVEFAGLFPFYVSFTANGAITGLGPSLRRLAPSARAGQLVDSLLEPHRPSGPLDFGNMANSPGLLYTVRERHSGILVRGEFRRMDEELIFLGSPWFCDISELTTHHLRLQDFATHDPTLDLLQSLQLHKIASADLRELTQRLATSEACLQALLKALPLGVATLDDRERLSYANPCLHGLLDPDDLLQLVRQQDLARDVSRAGATHSFEAESDARGKKQHLLITVFSIPQGNALPARVGLLVQDITREKFVDQELRLTAERRREYLELQREFVSMVSHEFRTPLTAIEGSLYLLQRALQQAGALAETVTPRVEKWLGLQAGAVATLKELVDQVLVLNQIEHESAKRVVSPQAPAPLISKLVQGFNDTLHGPRVEFRDELSADYTAEFDPGLVQKAVENLISNGLKYSWPERPVRVRLWHESDGWTVEVADQGRGIPAADQARLFKPFFRASNVLNVPGTGLGLAIVERTMRFHGGRVDFESQHNVGSRFVLRFPHVLPSPDEDKASRHPFLPIEPS